MGQALQSAPAGHRAAFSYERRRPEETTLYQVVQEQFETFLAQGEAKTGTGLPEFVKDEFEAFLECGILAHGFLRVRCAGCSHEKFVAFSCKRRGFCPSCGARRMAENAARSTRTGDSTFEPNQYRTHMSVVERREISRRIASGLSYEGISRQLHQTGPADDLPALKMETEELISIFVAIAKSAKRSR